MEQAVSRYDVVGIASSAGGVKALQTLLAGLPAGFPAAFLVVQHLDPNHRSLIVDILARVTSLRVKQAEEGEPIEPGNVYVAPPNRHLLVTSDKTLTLTDTSLVHFLRPSADLLFDSIAGVYGQRSLAVVLTGTGGDGSMGIQAIKRMGGFVVAQDEATSEFFGMPRSAIATGDVDLVLPLDQIAGCLAKFQDIGHG